MGENLHFIELLYKRFMPILRPKTPLFQLPHFSFHAFKPLIFTTLQ